MSEDRTLARIAALLRQAEGTSNEHEADAFMQAAQRLATTHSIDLAVARAHTAKREAREQPVIKRVDIGPAGKRGLRTFAELFLACGRPNDVAFDIANNSAYVIAYGMPSDIAVAEALYASLAVQMVRASDAYVRSDAHRNDRHVTWDRYYDPAICGPRYVERSKPVPTATARINFQQAFAHRIERRLTDAKNDAQREAVERARQERAADTNAATPDSEPTGTELAIRGKEVEIRDFRQAHTQARGSWKGGRAASGHSDRARMAGDRAARTARLGTEHALGGTQPALDRRVAL